MKNAIISAIITLLISITYVYAEGNNSEVMVTIPKLRSEINGQEIDNLHNKYPNILYNEQIYMPLADNYINGLGIYNFAKDKKEINLKYKMYYPGFKGDLGGYNEYDKEYIAEIAEVDIYYYDEKIEYNNQDYPILKFRDEIYIPLNWEMAKELDIYLYYKESHGFNVVSNIIYDVTDIVVVDDWIFYIEDYKLYKMKSDGSELTLFKNLDVSSRIIIQDKWIYYQEGYDKLYKIDIEGKNNELVLDNVDFATIYMSHDELQEQEGDKQKYILSANGGENYVILGYSLNQTTEEVMNANIDSWIFTIDTTQKLCKYNIKTQEKQFITDYKVNNMQSAGEWLYFFNEENSFFRINKTSLYIEELNINHNIIKSSRTYVVKDDFIYFVNENDNKKIYAMKFDGSDMRKLNDDYSSILFINGDWIYYEQYYGQIGTIVHRLNIKSGKIEAINFRGEIKNFIINEKKYTRDEAGLNYLDGFIAPLYTSTLKNMMDVDSIKLEDNSILIASNNRDNNEKASIQLTRVDLDHDEDRVIYESEKEASLILHLNIDETHVKWVELYKSIEELYYDIYVYNHNTDELKIIERMIPTTEIIFSSSSQEMIWEDYLAYVVHDDIKSKSYIKLYNLKNNKIEKTEEFEYVKYENGYIPSIFSIDIDNGNLVYGINSRKNNINFKLYNINKKKYTKKVNIKIDNEVLYVPDIKYNYAENKLGIALVNDNDGYYTVEIGYVNMKKNKYMKIKEFSKNEDLISNGSFEITDGYLMYNTLVIEDNGINRYGNIVDLSNDKTITIKGSYKLININDFLGNLRLSDREVSGHMFLLEFHNIVDVINNK